MATPTVSVIRPHNLFSAPQYPWLGGCKFIPQDANLHWPSTISLKSSIVHGKFSTRAAHQTHTNNTIQQQEEDYDDAMNTEALHGFINLCLGSWTGSFLQFDALGNVTQRIDTKLRVTSYGEDELVSLLQTLQVKQAPSKTAILGGQRTKNGVEWEEYKLRETNMITVDKHQQIGFFPQEKAFSLRHQTADMLDRVLRVGVLGEDDTDEEFPLNLKVPPRSPSVVCESCLYSMDGNSRIRAFHILNQRGLVDMIGAFHETREQDMASAHVYFEKEHEDRIIALLGKWSGHSVTKRSGFYGATIAESDIDLQLQMDGNGRLIQDITSTSGGGTNVHWTGTVEGGLVIFDGGFQMTLLPGGMYLASPTSVARSVAESQSFHLEFAWMESPGKRRRLIRTYDAQGLVVSTTYINEVKV